MDSNEREAYERGWNDAIRAAAKVAASNRSLAPTKDAEIAADIRLLRCPAHSSA